MTDRRNIVNKSTLTNCQNRAKGFLCDFFSQKDYPFVKEKALLRKKILQGKTLINKALGLGAKKNI